LGGEFSHFSPEKKDKKKEEDFNTCKRILVGIFTKPK
jgi:hypothetical protein